VKTRQRTIMKHIFIPVDWELSYKFQLHIQPFIFSGAELKSICRPGLFASWVWHALAFRQHYAGDYLTACFLRSYILSKKLYPWSRVSGSWLSVWVIDTIIILHWQINWPYDMCMSVYGWPSQWYLYDIFAAYLIYFCGCLRKRPSTLCAGRI